jgi:glycosyltransferase involved in cell wall biosynthesis
LIRVNSEEIPLLEKFNKSVFFVPNGFPPQFRPLNKAECRVRLSLSPEKKIIFCLGDLVERKGFAYLVNAMAQISASRKNVICYIGGKGPEEKNLIKQIHENNLGESVHLLGFIPDQMVPVWMNAADLFVLPSIHESFGIVQIEALACGTPAISTTTVGSREIIVSDEIGLLCEPASAGSLAAAVLQGLDTQWDRKKIIDYAAQFSWDHVVKSLMPVYSGVMEAGKNHE